RPVADELRGNVGRLRDEEHRHVPYAANDLPARDQRRADQRRRDDREEGFGAGERRHRMHASMVRAVGWVRAVTALPLFDDAVPPLPTLSGVANFTKPHRGTAWAKAGRIGAKNRDARAAFAHPTVRVFTPHHTPDAFASRPDNSRQCSAKRAEL